ncbi:Sporulation related domain-containing protein [Lutimaribacter pacificus]|uniref:Sporulation related domain-containing protein n=1 Tax=Lutimaribacter pacificus TaxID=391948 RepID=A0A1H0LLG8_9RHOB|nr:SPOR domain-containing protein [Lutimaribacter pacificus]SDO68821.1 Sporulation related domain-containing protein [Lutimaribacter pacificus]SHK06009.1 Sporulation related domain-containing protein [Lutimaribacter pacificus]
MADIHLDAQGGQPVPGTPVGTVANWIGAVISVALLVGVAVWGYKLLVRDVSGVPVVRAAQGPMRVQPDDPGGRPAAHQGLAVNQVAAVGTAGDPADRLVLAPRPVDLTDEDTPAAQLAAAATPDPAPQSAAEADEPVAGAPLQPAAVTDVDDLVAQLTAGAEPLDADADADAGAGTVATADTEEAEEIEIARPTTGLARSLRPQTRPAGLGQRVASVDPAAVAAAVAAAAGMRDIDPAAIPAGTRLAQLGAYDSEDIARREWDRLELRFGDYMEGKDRVIERAQSGGRTFYRLRAMGFDDLADARRFCAAFVSEKADCIPVVTR